MSAEPTPDAPARVAPLDLVLALTAGLIGYLVGEYGTGALVAAAIGDAGPAGVPSWVWLPWIAGPVLCGLLAGTVLPSGALPRGWHKVLAGAGVPLLASPVTLLVVGEVGARLLTDIAVQVVVGGLVALVAATVRGRVEARTGAPGARQRPSPARYT